jgi:hypothetical protein
MFPSCKACVSRLKRQKISESGGQNIAVVAEAYPDQNVDDVGDD